MPLLFIVSWLGGDWPAATHAQEEEPPLQPEASAPANPPIAPPSSPPTVEEAPPAAPGMEEEPPLAPEGPKPTVAPSAGGLDSASRGLAPPAEPVEAETVCDLVVGRVSHRSLKEGAHRVQLLPKRLPLPLPPESKHAFLGLDSKGKATLRLTMIGAHIRDIQYYELRMLQRAAEEAHLETEELTRADANLPREMLERATGMARAAALLNLAISEHDSAVERNLRLASEWRSVREDLVQALFNLQITDVRKMMIEQRMADALAACDRLKATCAPDSPRYAVLRRLFEQLLLHPAADDLRAENFAGVRSKMEEFAARFPFEANAKHEFLRKQLIQRAEALVEQAKQDRNPKLLEEVVAIWPEMAGLEDVRRQMSVEYPMLHVGYRQLPRTYSPLTARTPVERHAVALTFESLVQWTAMEDAGYHYAPCLAKESPAPLPRGRQFQLPLCAWSDSQGEAPHLCTAEDVNWTVQLLKRCRPTGFPRAWQELMDETTSLRAEDPFQVTLCLKRDHWQPLTFMDFMIVPKNCFPTCGEDPAELTRFNQNPVGTGPYLPAGDADERQARFIANPLYRKPGLPQIREIVFHQMDGVEAQAEFLKGNLQMIYGVSPEHVVQLRRQGNLVEKLPARSVDFLAPNHRLPLLQNVDLRLALAHQIDREAILNAYFRPEGDKKDHAALNGPYPGRSWACNPDLKGYSRQQAAAHWSRFRAAQGNSNPTLNLIYPDSDPETARACSEIKRQLEPLGLTLNIQAIEPAAFFQTVVEGHNFELAYWRHDFEDESYWLWPLFDPLDAGAGGANFMGYTPDQDLHDLFGEMATHKQFRKIREQAHKVHEYLYRQAVLIPLWELETYVALSPELRGVKLDPLRLFRNVETWSIAP